MGGEIIEILEEFKKAPSPELAKEVISFRGQIRANTGSEIGFLLKKLQEQSHDCEMIRHLPFEELVTMSKIPSFVEYMSEKYDVPWLTERHLSLVNGYRNCIERYREVRELADWVIAKIVLETTYRKLDTKGYLSELGVAWERAMRIVKEHYTPIYQDYMKGAPKTRELLRLAKKIRDIDFMRLETTFIEGMKFYTKQVEKLLDLYAELGKQPTWVLAIVDPRGAADLGWVRMNYLDVYKKMEQDFMKHKMMERGIILMYQDLTKVSINPTDILLGNPEATNLAQDVLHKISVFKEMIRQDYEVLHRWFYLTAKDRDRVLEMLRKATHLEKTFEKHFKMRSEIMVEPVSIASF